MATANGKVKHSDEIQNYISKVERYKWSVQDEPGEFMYIDKTALVVDHSYQRNINPIKTKAIASDWSWTACGAILVAKRTQGLYVIDGQHRVMAARKRTDIIQLPCLVFPSLGVTEEAKSFLTVQMMRKSVSAYEKFNALLVVEDTSALLVKRICEDFGITIVKASKTAKTVTCISVLLKWANTRPDMLERVWPIIVASCEGNPIKETIVEGVLYIESQLAKNNASIVGTVWADRVVKIGSENLHNSAIAAAQAFKRGGARVWAMGMTQLINKGLQNRLNFNIS